MPSPGASPIPTWLLLVLMAFGAKRQRVDRRGSQAAGDGDACRGHDGDGPLSTANASRTVTALKAVSPGGTAVAVAKARPRLRVGGLSRRISMSTRPPAPRSSSHRPRDVSTVLSDRGFASSNRQIGAGRPVTGEPRFLGGKPCAGHCRPDPEIPNSRSPNSRLGRETGREPPFPDSAGTGKRAPIGRKSGNRWYPSKVGGRAGSRDKVCRCVNIRRAWGRAR
jgi:hypothetical protein